VEVSSCWKEDINGALQGYIDRSFCFQFKVLKKSNFKEKEKSSESHHFCPNMLWMISLLS
jgi:hypothetical protein